MPNHIVNELRLLGVAPEVLAPLIAGRQSIDFEVLVPLPVNHWPGSVNVSHEKAFPGTHLGDATAMWGTKWNAYALGDHSVRRDGEDMLLTFETAWSPPRGWIVALFNTLDCDITHFWQDEGSEKVWCEIYKMEPNNDFGPQWKQSEVPLGSADHRRLYKLQWGVETPEELTAE